MKMIYIYALISVFVSGIVSLINWNYCKKYINLKFIIIPNFKPHIKYLTVFFFNSIMVTIYVNIDITMLGWIQGDYSVGIYSTATKLYTIIKDLLTSIYLVSVPRLSYYYSQDRLEDYKDLFTNMVSYLSILLLPASIGLICVSDGAIYLLGGNQYMNAITPLQILCISLIFAQFGGLITLCVNVSIGKENTNLIGSIIGALSNAILNLFFITKWSYIGAAITTTIAEMIVFLYCFYSLENKNRFINFKKLKSLFKDILLGCILIIIVSFILHYYINHIILRTILICLIGFLIYFFILYIRKNYILIDLLVKIKKKLIKY